MCGALVKMSFTDLHCGINEPFFIFFLGGGLTNRLYTVGTKELDMKNNIRHVRVYMI